MSYVVQTGETITAVSRKLKTSFQALKNENPDAFGQTQDGRWFLKAGFKLESTGQPRSAPAGETTSKPAPVQTAAPVSGKTYTVQKGETIKAVTDKLGMSFQELKAANPGAVGKMADGRQFFFAGATLKTSGGFQENLKAAQNQTSPQPATPIAPAAPETRSIQSTSNAGRSSNSAGLTGETNSSYNPPADTTPVGTRRNQTVSHYDAEYGTSPRTATARTPQYQSTGFVRSSQPGSTFVQNPITASSDFIRAGQQKLTQSKYVVETPLNQDLNLAFGFVNERHEAEDFSHSRKGLENKGVTMGLRFRF